MWNLDSCVKARDLVDLVCDDNTEFDYRVDVCRVTQGAYIEGL